MVFGPINRIKSGVKTILSPQDKVEAFWTEEQCWPYYVLDAR